VRAVTPRAAQELRPGHAVLPEYLTVAEVASMLRVSTKTIYRLVGKEPTMPALKLVGAVVFPRERLLRWLQQREQGPGRRLLASVKSQASVAANGACADPCAEERS
jgi:excisionase family DNA binding protein